MTTGSYAVSNPTGSYDYLTPTWYFSGFKESITTGHIEHESQLDLWYCDYCGTFIDAKKHVGKCSHCGAGRKRL